MKNSSAFLIIAFLLSSCAPVATTSPTPTVEPARTATLSPTVIPSLTSTSTPTPKIYTLRIEFSTTSDWSNLSIMDPGSILGFRLVNKQGDLQNASVEKTYLSIHQTPDDAKALKEVGIIVDYYISGNAINMSIPFLLGKGGDNDSTIRFYYAFNGMTYSLLDEVYRLGSVKGHEDTNPYKFSFDLNPLFQSAEEMAAHIQPNAGTGKFIFEYYRSAFEKAFPELEGELNVFTSNWDGTHLTPVTNGLKGLNRIESIAPDGRLVLISSRPGYFAKGDLYLIDLNLPASDPKKLVGGVETAPKQAIFLDNNRVVYIGRGVEGYGFYTNNIDGTDPKRIGAPKGKVWSIVSADESRVYWGTVENKRFKDSTGSLYAYGDTETLWWINIDGSGQGKLESNGQQIIGSYAFSSDGSMLAWIPAQYEPGCTTSAFYTKWITEGTYTEWASLPQGQAARHGISESWLGKTIDMEFVNAYVRNCFIVYVASLSNLDKATGIVLMPPVNLIRGDFTFGEVYKLKWKSDGSTLLLFNDGTEGYFIGLIHEPLLYYIDLTNPEPRLNEYKHGLFSRSNAKKTRILDVSPDGKQILFTNGAGGPYIRILDLETMMFSDLFGKNITPDSDASRIIDIYWLP